MKHGFLWLGTKRLLLLTLCGLLSAAAWSFPGECAPFSGETASFRVSQVVSEYPRIRIFLTRPEKGEPLRGLSAETLEARLGDERLPVLSVRPFSRAADGVAYIFLVDISRSLHEAQLADMRSALSAWVNAMGPKDRAMVVTFGERVHLLRDFDGNTAALRAAVKTLRPTDMLTELHGGLARALDMGKRIDTALPSRKVIVVLSDGKNEMLGGITRAEVLRRMEEGTPPIFALGYFAPPLNAEKEEYLRLLGELALSSGGAYFQPDGTSVEAVFAAMRRAIDGALVVDLDAGKISPDGSLKRLSLSSKTAESSFADAAPLRLLPPEVHSASLAEESAAQTSSADATPEAARMAGTAGDSPAETAGEMSPGAADTSSASETPSSILPTEGDTADKGTPPAASPSEATTKSSGTPEATGENRSPSGTDTVTPPSAAPSGTPKAETAPARRMTPFLYILLGGIALIAVTALFLLSREKTAARNSTAGKTVPEAGRRRIRLRMEISRSGTVLGSYAMDVTDRIVLGRGAECDVRLSGDETVSHKHCEFRVEGETLTVRDLGSTNGTLLDGASVSGARAVGDGARLSLGNTTVTLFLGEPPRSASRRAPEKRLS